jgi:penicillin-binding protein 1A
MKFRVKVSRLRSRGDRVRAWSRRHPRLVRTTALVLFGGFALVGGLIAGTWQAVCRDCPSIAQIYVWEPVRATKILDHEGKLITELYQERRTPVDIASLPPYVPHAFVAVEDHRFYKHNGFDPRGLLRAARNLVIRFGVHGGGSTITQQLARHMFTENIGFERRLLRGALTKLKEVKVARELENVYSKDQILAAYINQVNYGHNWFGIETAAQHFYGKPAVKLNPAEAALLAAVINRPSFYDPFEHPERALRRRNLVLQLMADQKYLTEAEARQWSAAPLPESAMGVDEARLAPYFVEWVRSQLDQRFGSQLYRSGLRVYTTLDADLQRAAQEAMDSGWVRIERVPSFRHPKYADVIAQPDRKESNQTSYLQGLFIAMDPKTGAVRALVGGRDFKDSKFNRATQALRQPGSVFKPFVMTAAVAGGIPVSHMQIDSPFSMPNVDGTLWEPQNYDPDYRGAINMRETLKHSVNIPTIKLALEVGLESVVQYARRMGIRTQLPPFPAVSIGAADVYAMQVAEAYSVFATTGYRPSARAILRVEDTQGRVLVPESKPQVEQVLDSATTAVVRDLLRDALDHGTGYPARDPGQGNLPYDIPAAGKTGTTNDNTNIWYAGFTPNLLAIVWFGFDRPQKILPSASGGVYAAPVWGRFMRAAYYGENAKLAKPADWPWPSKVSTRRIDRTSGKLAGEFCPLDVVYDEVFTAGTEPTELCDLHGPLKVAPGRDTVRTDTLRH